MPEGLLPTSWGQCNAAEGVEVHTACTQVGNVPATPIKYANDLDIAPDGTIYFTDSSHIPPPFDKELGYYDTMTGCILTFCQACLWRSHAITCSTAASCDCT